MNPLDQFFLQAQIDERRRNSKSEDHAMTSESCPECSSRNWTIYREGNRLTIRCGQCDSVTFVSAILDAAGRIMP